MDNGEWVEGFFGRHTSLDAMIIDRPYPAYNGDLTALDFWMVDPSTVGQYTGLTDKNGKRIFEGDIVRFFNSEEYSVYSVMWKYHRWLVQMHADYQVCPDDLDEDFCSNAEIIGNIYDNPELVEGRK